MNVACATVGWDPAALEVTVGVNVATPADVAASETPVDPARVLTGTPNDIAAELRAYREAGVGHLICGALAHTTYNYTTEGMTLVIDGVALYQAEAHD